jgi:cell division protein FtsB
VNRAAARLLPALVIAASMYYAVWGGEYTALDLRRLRHEQALAEDSLTLERARVDSLRRMADRLENDPATIEEVARERFGMIRSGEVLYRFVEVGDPPATAPATP